jgi:hypothetical protein
MTEEQLRAQIREEILKVQALPEEKEYSFIFINLFNADEYVKHLFLVGESLYSDSNFHIRKRSIHFIPSRVGCYNSKGNRRNLTCLCWTKSRNGQWRRNLDHKVEGCPSGDINH